MELTRKATRVRAFVILGIALQQEAGHEFIVRVERCLVGVLLDLVMIQSGQTRFLRTDARDTIIDLSRDNLRLDVLLQVFHAYRTVLNADMRQPFFGRNQHYPTVPTMWHVTGLVPARAAASLLEPKKNSSSCCVLSSRGAFVWPTEVLADLRSGCDAPGPKSCFLSRKVICEGVQYQARSRPV
jgi:hypothetical protein